MVYAIPGQRTFRQFSIRRLETRSNSFLFAVTKINRYFLAH